MAVSSYSHHSLEERLYLLRHGHSEANEAGLIVSDPNNGVAGYGLTQKGRDQVAVSIEGFARRPSGSTTGVIYSSPFLRAVETAEIAAIKLGWPVRVTDNLRERGFGEFELTGDTHYQQVWDQDEIDPSHTQWGVESVIEVWQRLEDFLEEVSISHSAQTVLMVTHGDPASILMRKLRGIDFPSHHRTCAPETGQLISVPFRQI